MLPSCIPIVNSDKCFIILNLVRSTLNASKVYGTRESQDASYFLRRYHEKVGHVVMEKIEN